MNGAKRIELIRKHHVRLGRVVDLACATATGDFDMGCDDLLDDILHLKARLHPTMQPLLTALLELDEGDQNDGACCLEALANAEIRGYACQFHAPSDNQSDDPIFGSYYARWIYADTIEEAWAYATPWGDECRQQQTLALESEA